MLRRIHLAGLCKTIDECVLCSTSLLRQLAGTSYATVFSAHHNFAIRSVVQTSLYLIPSTATFLELMHEDGKEKSFLSVSERVCYVALNKLWPTSGNSDTCPWLCLFGEFAEQSCRDHAQGFISDSLVIIDLVESHFVKRGLGLDWWTSWAYVYSFIYCAA